MATFRIGCVPITWKNVPQDQVLREIVEAGYEGVPAGPRKGKSTQEVLDDLAGYGLEPAPTYLGGDFWQKETQADALERARRIATFAREAGITELYVATGGSRSFVGSRGLNRMQVAGRVQPEDGLPDAEFRQLAETLNMIGEVTLAEGVSICFHNHVASARERLYCCCRSITSMYRKNGVSDTKYCESAYLYVTESFTFTRPMYLMISI